MTFLSKILHLWTTIFRQEEDYPTNFRDSQKLRVGSCPFPLRPPLFSLYDVIGW